MISTSRHVGSIATLLFLSTIGLESSALGQADTSKPTYLGAKYCSGCHEKGPAANFTDQIVRLTEFDTWTKKDRHNGSLNRLKVVHKERCDNMDKILKWPKKVTEDARCLSCHSVALGDGPNAAAAGETFEANEGVTCTACHGPDKTPPGAVSGWVTGHIIGKINENQWRKLPMEKKTAAGYINVRDPVVRSKLCLSCHVGNVEEGKVITHEMYAAGHPPLQSIEIATFSEQEPRHYRLKREQTDARAKEYVGYIAGELEETKIAVIGAVMTLRESMALTSKLAEKPVGGAYVSGDTGTWPEIARFDCAACHHELKRPSWRQERGYQASPGRILPSLWPEALIATAVRVTTKDEAEFNTVAKKYKDLVTELYKAYDSRQFGDPQAIQASAAKIVGWCDELLKKVEAVSFDKASGKSILTQLTILGTSDGLDYDAARQVSWAFRKVLGEYNLVTKTRPKDALSVQLELDTLSRRLALDVRTDKTGYPVGIIENLAERMQSLNGYDPARFKSSFEKLAEGLDIKLTNPSE